MVRAVALGLAVALAAASPTAAEFVGEPLGLSIGPIDCSAVMPQADLWLIGTEFGVFRSRPDAQGWEFASEGLPRDRVGCLHVVPGSPVLIYAGVGSCTPRGIYCSADGGTSWTPRTAGLGSRLVWAIAHDQNDASVLYAGTENGLYWSTNAGLQWSPRGFAGSRVSEIVSDPSGGGRLWASVAGAGVYRSTNQGASWDSTSFGMMGHPFLDDIKVSVTGDTLYAAGNDPYRSTDGGNHWIDIKGGTLPTYGWIAELAVLTGDAREILAGHVEDDLYRSRDAGDHWERLARPGPVETLSATLPGAGGVLAGQSNGGVWRSFDQGDSWVSDAAGLATGLIYSIGLCGSRWLAGSMNTVSFSDDAGETWQTRNVLNPDEPLVAVYAIATAADDTTAYCAGETMIWSGCVARTRDAGDTWTTVLETWNPIYTVACDPVDPRWVYAAGDEVYVSSNGGETWQEQIFGDAYFEALLVVADAPGYVLLGGSLGTLLSTNHGKTWTLVDPAVTAVAYSVGAGPETGIFAGARSGNVYRSTNDGLTWSPYGNGALPNIADLEAGVPGAGLLAATPARLWHMEDGAWIPLPEEAQPWFPGSLSLCAVPATTEFLAGSERAGIWHYRTGEAAAPEAFPSAPPALRVAGSPSSGPLTILLSQPVQGPVLLQILDAAGRVVREHRAAGTVHAPYRWRWDARDDADRPLPAGMYFVRLRAPGVVLAGRACLIR